MRNKEIVKLLKSMASLNDEDKLKRDMIVEDFEGEIRYNRYVLIGGCILLAGIVLGWFFFGYYPQWYHSVFQTLK